MNIPLFRRGLKNRIAPIVAAVIVVSQPAAAQEPPRVEHRGDVDQLIIDGQPQIILGGELHNSSASSPIYMAPVWNQLQKNGVSTVLSVASWEMLEPVEGRFNFAEVDDQIAQARTHNIKLVLLWFGAYKNAASTYAPSWVRRDELRFPRGGYDPNTKVAGMASFLRTAPFLTPFNDKLVQADARAFAELMAHVRKVDRDGTVIMVQVENEVGMIGDSRDRSPQANAAWAQQVPADLIAYLSRHRDRLTPHLLATWSRQGYRSSGTWQEVFGDDKAADEIFMAWHFGHYVETVAKAGAAQHKLPMYTNAWLGPQDKSPQPGDYPSGGPVARMMDVWKASAPTLSFLAPDIYIDDFSGTLAQYAHNGNAIFVPESKADPGNLFVALGKYRAIGFSPFGIEDVPADSDMFKAYAALRPMLAQIAKAQQTGTIRGFKVATGEAAKETIGDFGLVAQGPRPSAGVFGAGTGTAEVANGSGYAIVMQTAPEEFVAIGRNLSLTFTAPGQQVEVDWVQEGSFNNGAWTSERTINGDERFFMFDPDKLRTLKIRLLRR